MESDEGLKRPQVSFLHQIFGVMIVACQPSCQVIGSVQMRQDGLFETSDSVLFLQRQVSPLIQAVVDKTLRPAILFPEPNSRNLQEYPLASGGKRGGKRSRRY